MRQLDPLECNSVEPKQPTGTRNPKIAIEGLRQSDGTPERRTLIGAPRRVPRRF